MIPSMRGAIQLGAVLLGVACLFFAGAAKATPLSAADADRQRIQRHLAAVEAALRARPTTHLSAAQAAARAASLDWLHAYWTAGEFPRNSHHLGERRPYFVDDAGRACAVADLIVQSGHGALADRVRAEHNFDRIAEMRSEGLVRWAHDSGLTVDELALIQPGYCICLDENVFSPVCGADGFSYWNACAASACGGVQIAHQGECVYEDLECRAPFVSGCGSGLSNGICDPILGGSAKPAWKHEVRAFLDEPTCDGGCTIASSSRTAGAPAPRPPKPFILWLLIASLCITLRRARP